jgi:phage terminase large subunit
VTEFEFRGSAVDLLTAREPIVIASGAAGTGKTLAALCKAHLTALQVPRSVQLIVRQTHASLKGSTLAEFERNVVAQELASGEVVWFGGSGRKPAAYNYRNGSQILVGGLDQPAKFLSMSLDRIYVDEATEISITALETLLTRLRGSAPTYKQLLCMTNPAHPEHHLKKRADTGEARIIYSRHEDNPYLCGRDGAWTAAGTDYLKFLRTLTGTRRERYLHGRWVAQSGLVFSSWRDDANRIEPFEVPPEWPLFLSIDFGYSNPFVCQWWRVDPDGRLYLTREIHQTQTLVEDHAKRIKQILIENRDTEGWPTHTVCDHDAEDRATLTRHSGLATTAARKAVSRGVQLMDSRLRPAGDGRPRLFVFRDCVLGRDLNGEAQKRPRGFLGEVNGYVWAVERGADGIPREVPLKVHDHSMDAARYAVAHLDWNEPVRTHNPAAQRQSAPTAAASKWGRPVGR